MAKVSNQEAWIMDQGSGARNRVWRYPGDLMTEGSNHGTGTRDQGIGISEYLITGHPDMDSNLNQVCQIR